VIAGDLSHFPRLLSLAPGLWVRDDFSYSLVNPRYDLEEKAREDLGGKGTVNASVMLWRGDNPRKVWDTFTPEVMTEVHGDQNFISRTLWPEGIHLIPDDSVSSFKYHVMRGCDHGSIVVFHGQPKPHDLVKQDPLRQMWEAA